MNKKTAKNLLLTLLGIAMAFSIVMPCFAQAGPRDTRTIRVGWYESGSENSPAEATGAHGYDYEYLQALSQFTGWTYEYVNGTWDECLQRLENGEVDLMGFVGKTPEREKVFGFPNLPMAVVNSWLVIGSQSPLKRADKASLDGLTVGVVRGGSYNRYFEEYCAQNDIHVKYKEYLTYSELSPALEIGEIDGGVVSDEDMTATEQGLLRLSLDSRYYVTDIDDKALLAELESAMAQVNAYSPDLNSSLYKKYFSLNVYGSPVFTAAEQRFITENPDILVKYDAGWPPIEYLDAKSGAYVGVSPDLFALLSEKTGLNFVYEGSTSGQVLSELESADEKNVVTTISYDFIWGERHNVHVTQPFITSAIVKLGRNPDAENPVIAINENAYFTYLLKDVLQGADTRHYAKQAERLEAVRRGEADYTFVTEDQANYYCSIPKYSELQYEKIPGYEQSVCISVTKNSDPELLTILSKGLASISRDEMTTIILKNTVVSYDASFVELLYKYRLPLSVLGVLLLAIIVMLIAMNVRRRKNQIILQTAYAQKQEALDAAEKASAAKGNFMSRISHEIRTPLNAVIGYNGIARSEISKPKNDAERKQADMRVMDCLLKSEMASRHLLTIINDVLDMSAIESGKIKVAHERFDFRNLISSLSAIFYSQAREKGVDFDVVFGSLTEEWFIGDQMRVNQILTNLLSNAIKFTPEGGSVTLTINQPEAETNAAHIHFTVTDTGIGMREDYLAHIWTPFEQEDVSISRRFGGTGLGLSITKNLVDLMRGSIAVKSKPGKGTTFDVDLTFERTEQPNSSRTYDFSAVNALVVDDEQSACDYVKLLFTRSGARCDAVTSGEAALESFGAAIERGQRYTVCLVDWRMPQMDGIETVRAIRALAGEELPIIILTAYDFSDIAEAAKAAGVNMYISKPLFQSSLFDLLANICGDQKREAIQPSSEYDFGGARVLLAEDNAMNMEVAKMVLSSVNLEIESAVNGREALEMFENAPEGHYQVILMDVQMPEMDGHAATRAIRALDRPDAVSIPIIAMTADAFEENVAEALAAGMNDHISKPIDIQRLYMTLSSYIPSRV